MFAGKEKGCARRPSCVRILHPKARAGARLMTVFLMVAILGGTLVVAQAQPGGGQPGFQNPPPLPSPPGVDLSRPIGKSLVQQPPLEVADDDPKGDAE